MRLGYQYMNLVQVQLHFMHMYGQSNPRIAMKGLKLFFFSKSHIKKDNQLL